VTVTENVNRVLVLDADSGVVESIAEIARGLDYSVASTTRSGDFISLFDAFRPTLLILQPESRAEGVLDVVARLGARGCKAPIVLLGAVDDAVVASAEALGASLGLSMQGRLSKPLAMKDLSAKLIASRKQDRALDAADLERGIAAGEVAPYYQPKASLKRNGWTIDGVEALARWHHPRLGVVMPDEFMPLAERTGLIGALTNRVLDIALKQVREWNGAGLKLSCAVNLPPALVMDPTFPERVAALLEQHGLDGDRLVLEITETAMMQNPTTTMDVLTRLRVRRVGLALDDFGTGYSSLTQLHQMPFDEMKIDKSLVTNVPHSREANTMVGSLIELGHNLGLEICAEGVENKEALDMLAVLRCDRCQGYVISRAVPAREIGKVVTNWNGNGRSRARARSSNKERSKAVRS
jgi:EAL domain-containing protein (putative c-di-GMP-specific phosphodiesterase class I)